MRRSLLLVPILLAAGIAWLALAHEPAPRPRAPLPDAAPLEPAPHVPPSGPARTPDGGPAQAGLELLVRAREALWSDAPTVAQLAFEVRRPDADPRSTANDGELLASGTTDASGVARVALPAGLPLDARGAPLAVVVVSDARYLKSRARPRVPVDGVSEAILITQLGATARGRVVDAEGAPVIAQVSVVRWFEIGGTRSLRQVASAATGADGRFALALREDWLGATLLAESEGRGSAALVGVDLTLAAPPQDLELVVSGSGSLVGRVLDARGAPVEALPLLARLAVVDPDAPEPELSIRRAQGQGAVEQTARTDGAGRFRFDGLRREPYVVLANLRSGSDYGHDTRLTPAPELADGRELTLRVEGTQLIVRLLDADGSEWRGTPPLLDGGPGLRGAGEGWREVAKVHVVHCTEAGEALGESLIGRRLDRARMAFALEREGDCLVHVHGASFPDPPRRVAIPAGAARVEVDVRAREDVRWGTIVPDVAFADTDARSRSYAVHLQDLATGLVLCGRASRSEPLRAPVGRYRLVAEGWASLDHQHGTLWGERTLGRAEVEVEVLEARELRVPLELGLGARIELELAGSAGQADHDAVLRREPWLLGPCGVPQRDARAACAFVELRRPARGPEPVYRVSEDAETLPGGPHLDRGWPLGLRETSQFVGTGACTLVARLPGGREVATEVVLREGETTRVRLEFPPPR